MADSRSPTLPEVVGSWPQEPTKHAQTGASWRLGFWLGGSIVLTWGCTDRLLAAIAPFYGAAPKPREAMRRLCPVVASWPAKDLTTEAASVLEAELTAAGVPQDLKVYPGAKHSLFNDQSRNYNAEAANDAWRRALAFFTEHVRRDSGRPIPETG